MLTWMVDYLICAELAVFEGSLSDLFWIQEGFLSFSLVFAIKLAGHV